MIYKPVVLYLLNRALIIWQHLALCFFLGQVYCNNCMQADAGNYTIYGSGMVEDTTESHV